MTGGNKAGDFESFHAMLKRYRARSGKTQRQAALHHGWTTQYYSDIERGKRLPPLTAEQVMSLASYLGGEWRPFVVAYVCAKLQAGDPYCLADAFSIYSEAKP